MLYLDTGVDLNEVVAAYRRRRRRS